MSRSVNRVLLIGNLGADPELRYTKGNTPVCNMRIATSYTPRAQEGGQEQVEWHRVVAFGEQANACAKFLAKGRQVYVEGRNATRVYEKDGQRHQSTEVIVERIVFLGSRADGQPANTNQQKPAPKQYDGPEPDEGPGIGDDNIRW